VPKVNQETPERDPDPSKKRFCRAGTGIECSQTRTSPEEKKKFAFHCDIKRFRGSSLRGSGLFAQAQKDERMKASEVEVKSELFVSGRGAGQLCGRGRTPGVSLRELWIDSCQTHTHTHTPPPPPVGGVDLLTEGTTIIRSN